MEQRKKRMQRSRIGIQQVTDKIDYIEGRRICSSMGLDYNKETHTCYDLGEAT